MASQLADSPPYRITLIEDDDADAGLVEWALRRQGDFPYQLQHVTSLEEFLGHASSPGSDVILLDLNLPGYRGLEAFHAVTENAPDAAIVVLTGLDDNEVAMAAVHSGAQDYLVKQNVNPHDICRAIHYAAERRAGQVMLLRICDDFVAHVSHELRTPLTAAFAAVEMLHGSEAGELDPMQARLAGIAVTNLRLLRTMVADLIDSAMVHSGTLSVHPELVRLADVIPPVLDALSPLVERAGLTSSLNIADGLRVIADPDRLVQIVTNLLSNSIKHTPPGGALEITAVAGEAGCVALTCTDTGYGIPEHSLPRVFDRLYQVPNDTTRTSRGGLGLGLYLCRALIQAQNGDIRLESAPGRGTRVTVTLPSAGESPTPP
jgi:signal transduction histidine kinase